MRVPELYERLMRVALAEASLAGASGDIPIGAVVTDADGHVLGTGRNVREVEHDPTGHAEIVALREAAAARGSSRLDDCILFTTLEPCVMCAGAALTARVARVVFGAWDAKAGAAGSVYDLLRDGRLPQRSEVVGGVLEAECAAPLSEFFAGR
ncbi:nucleoside deaminase [Gulosibacter sp. ACHW.36C]|jgi:tRNA(adenine34) deaminase|uniref:tRNA-specific adenosine deaminase n=1 Tax=Gulosibacter sediminis TaxID=1729695 RepID=A0ABY4MW18_9MICO|nr:nucleoside deaminase [Gulosibacter sediminis]UQN14627.1 nucleoside deaminase [Gulosibacter sediminis]